MNSSVLDSLNYEQLQTWVVSGKNTTIPSHLVKYLELLEVARSMYDKYESKKAIFTLLIQHYGLTEHSAQKIYAEALNFFYSDNGIKRKAWGNITADKLDKLALLAIANDDFECARRCFVDAAKLRMESDAEQAIPRELLDRRFIVYTQTPRDVGLPPANKKALAQFIDALPDIPVDHRMLLHRDANTGKQNGNVFEVDVQDIEFVEHGQDS